MAKLNITYNKPIDFFSGYVKKEHIFHILTIVIDK